MSVRKNAALAVAVAVVPFALLAAKFAFVCDDAFIAFRYAQSFARGLGLRYNQDAPPVEGYTQLGWVLWIGLFERFGLDPSFWSRATTLASGATLLGLVALCASRRMGTLGTAGAALVFATLPTVAVWSTGGLETMAFALALFLAFERLLGVERPRAAQAAAAAVAACVLRADAAYWLAPTLACALALGWRERRRELVRAALASTAAVALVLLALQVFRVAYFDDWIPNTARAKVGMSAFTLGRGARYLAVYVLTFPVLFAAAGLGAASALARRDARLACSALLAALTLVYGVLVGGDFMAMGRFFLPAAPHLALLAGGLLERLASVEPSRRAAALAALALLVVASVLPAFDAHLVPESVRARFHFRWNRGDEYVSEARQWQLMDERVAEWEELGRALRLHTTPDESLVCMAIGAVGYYSGLGIHDQFGLVDREAARAPLVPGERRSPGHDRLVPPRFFASRHPTWLKAYLRDRRRDDPRERGLTNGEIVCPLRPDQGFPPGKVLVLVPFPERDDG